MESGVRAAAREKGNRRRGVSVAGFLATLAVLLLLLVVVLEFVNRWTRIPEAGPPNPATRTSLELAVRALTRDLGAAASGLLPPVEAIRPVSDNTPPGRAFSGPVGQMTEIRPGTDQVGLRGILRSPPLSLEPSDRATGRPFPLTPSDARNAANASPPLWWLKVYAERRGGPKGGGGPGPAVSQVAALLRARPLPGRRKRFFVAVGDASRHAVARIVSFRDRTSSGAEGCAPPPDGCHLELVLDFADPDAVRLNPGGAPDAVRGLGPLALGGLLDDLVYFVAQGPKGRPPEYFIVNDPLSLRYPRPYLAVAENVGNDRWEVVRVADDVENLQAAYEVSKGGAKEWRADRPGASPLAPEELSEAGTDLLAVRLAVVAKGTERRRGAVPSDLLEEILPFDAPRPDRTFSPVGWAENPWARVNFDRETRFLLVRLEKSR
ncbi:MAG: hypothetical protein ACM3JH_08900 [Acidithiobacillales bacterium]